MDRHEKWVKVEPGTTIPAGQPYAVAHAEGNPRWSEFVYDRDMTIPNAGEWFMDSSWRPPLNLPTTPSVILAEVDDRLTEDKVLLFGPHHQKGSTWWSMNGSISVIPDEINSFEILWTEQQ